MPRLFGEGLFGEGIFGEISLPEPPSTPGVPDYVYLVEDVMRREVIGWLPLNNVSYEDYLNRPGSLQASLPMTIADQNVDLLDAGRRAIYVVRDGRIEWGGLLLDPQVPLGSEHVQIECLGWLGWFDMRDIWIDRQFNGEDQFVIFKTLVDDAQDESHILNGTGANLGITVTWDALSGVTRDRLEEYRYFNGKNLGEALRQLAALEDGFDFSMLYTAGMDGIAKDVVLSYPQQGTDYSGQPGFEYARGEKTNILRRGLQHKTSQMAWRIRGWGAGADTARLRSTQVNEDRRGVYPFFDGQGSFSSVVNEQTLEDDTAVELATRDHPIVLPFTEVDPYRDPQWSSVQLGDIYNVNIDDGYCSASGAHRLIGYRMDATTDRPTLIWQEA